MHQRHFYFAYGSNMDADRVRERGLEFSYCRGASLERFGLRFNKRSRLQEGAGHANIVVAFDEIVEGVLYELSGPEEIWKMDRFEGAPVQYGRDVVEVVTRDGGEQISAWTYFGNDAVLSDDLKPPRWYLSHLLAGRPFLSADYLRRLHATRILDSDVD